MEASIGKALEHFAKSIAVDQPTGQAVVNNIEQGQKSSPTTKNATYLLTSTKFTGSVLFEFNADGLLTRFDLTGAQLTTDQTSFILQKMPRTIDEIRRVLGNSKDAKLTKQKATGVTFEMFWDLANDKDRSSRKKSLAWWNRNNQAQRDAAYNYWPTYIRNIPAGLARKYVETYLNAELWNN